MKSNMIGDITDFIFIEKPKKVLPINKNEKIIKVKATAKCKD